MKNKTESLAKARDRHAEMYPARTCDLPHLNRLLDMELKFARYFQARKEAGFRASYMPSDWAIKENARRIEYLVWAIAIAS
jgi:hypothetical protein